MKQIRKIRPELINPGLLESREGEENSNRREKIYQKHKIGESLGIRQEVQKGK